MIKRLRIKFISAIMGIAFLMLCIIFALVLQFTRYSIQAQNISMIKDMSAGPFALTPPSSIEDRVPFPFFTVMIKEDGSITANGSGYYDLSDEAVLQSFVETVMSDDREIGELEQYNLRYYRKLSKPGPYPENETIIVFSDISNEKNIMGSMVKSCLIIGVCSMVMFFFVSLFLSKWAVKPVEQAWNQQKQFVADASHDLKTPITVIMTDAELLKDSDNNEEDRAKLSDNIMAMSVQMRGLVEEMLELTRADASSSSQVLSDVNFSKIAENECLALEPVFFESNRSLSYEIEPSLCLKGNEGQLRRLVEILLDNAKKYSDSESETRLELYRQYHYCMLSVSDHGDEISKEDLKNIFKRFFRIDKARSMNNSYGLGLSIAQTITQAHRGQIWAESKNGVNTFYVQLPL